MEYFLARQPIFDSKMKVIGYELFSYDGFENLIPMDTKEDQFASKVITKSFLLVNTESLTGGKKAFIRFSQNLIVNEIVTLLDKDLIAIELSDNITPDEKVLAACQKFKDSGYLMVLDDFNFQFSQMPFLQFADMVKVDSGKTGSDMKKSVVERLKSKNIKSLMMNVESEEEFKEAVELGYDYFQGNFFRKPFVISGRDIPGYKLTYLQMLKEIHQPEIDFDKMEEIIKRDVSLTYKLLRLINSAAFGIMREIKSIKQALVLLGMREVKKWVALIALSDMGKEKPEELVKNALLRAK
ncbi:MAG: HDOD domain-containing protein [Calditrichia bacterium]